MTNEFTDTQKAKEVEKCSRGVKGFIYWLINYVYIEDRKTKRAIPFILWPGQRKAVRKFFFSLFLLILKARQLGLTWLAAAYALWRAQFHYHEFIIIISAREDLAIEFLDRVKFMFDRQPDWLKPHVNKRSGSELSFGIEVKDEQGNIRLEGLNSVLKSIASTPDAGQSKTISLLILDESALNRYCKEIWSAASPTLEHAGGQAIILSNPSKDKPGWGWTRDKYIGSMKGENTFARMFLPWNEVPGRPENFLELKAAEEGLDDDEIVMQYPSTEEEAVSPLGGSYFGKVITGWNPYKGEVGRLVADEDDNIRFVEEAHGILEIWARPVSGWMNRYAIGSDIAEGLGGDHDYSTGYVYDRIDQRFVARMRSNKIEADLWGLELITLGKYYGRAMICPERTGAGITTVKTIQNADYEMLYYHRKPGKMQGEYVMEYGWNETKENKQVLCADLKSYFRETFTQVPCAILIDECSTFIRHENGKLEHEEGKHDDCVIGAGCTIQASIMMPAVEEIKNPERKNLASSWIEAIEQPYGDDFERQMFEESEPWADGPPVGVQIINDL